MEQRFIYGLYDEADGHIRYVGQTKDARKRLMYHRGSTRGANQRVGEWIAQMKQGGRRPQMIILDVVPAPMARSRENELIKTFYANGIESGYRLLNGGGAPIEPMEPELPLIGGLNVWVERVACATCGAESNDENTVIVANPVNEDMSFRVCRQCGGHEWHRKSRRVPWLVWWNSQDDAQNA